MITEVVTGYQTFRNIITMFSRGPLFCIFFFIFTELIHQLSTKNIISTLFWKHLIAFLEMSLSLFEIDMKVLLAFYQLRQIGSKGGRSS